MIDNRNLTCCKCNVPLEERKTVFNYLGHTFSADLPGCPICGMAFIPEEIVKGKMASVETELEEK